MPKEKDKLRKKTGNKCCVPYCRNYTSDLNPGVKFYLFPAERGSFPGRRQLWIDAVQKSKVEAGVGSWNPSRTSRICSDHFVGGERVDIHFHPGYAPSIFPNLGGKSKSQCAKELAAFRKIHGPLITAFNAKIAKIQENIVSKQGSEPLLPTFLNRSVAVECSLTDFDGEPCNEFPIFLCTMHGNEASTQACLPSRRSELPVSSLHQTEPLDGSPRLQPSPTGPTFTDSACRRSCTDTVDEANWSAWQSLEGFAGMKSITTDVQLRAMAGITLRTFNVLLSFLNFHCPRNQSMMSSPDRLLLFLMWLRLGLSSKVLGSIFGWEPGVVGDSLAEMLDVMLTSTQSWIFWPDRIQVRRTMPQIVADYYPSCQAIVFCLEVRVDHPLKKYELKKEFWSDKMQAYSVKYLLAMAPSGFVSFLSQRYGGSSSDHAMITSSGILSRRVSGSQFMTDKGLSDAFIDASGDKDLAVVPSFTNREQIWPCKDKRRNPLSRVHRQVERRVQRVRNFRILDRVDDGVADLQAFDKIMRVCCILTNMENPITKDNS